MMPRILYSIAAPGAALMDKLRFRSKLIAIAIICISAVAALTAYLVPLLGEQIQFTRSEIRGIAGVERSLELIRTLQVHRGLESRALAGDAKAGAALGEARGAANGALAGLQSWVKEEPAFNLDKKHDAASRSVSTLLASSGQGERAGRFAAHGAAIAELISFLEAVADSSNLTLDPEMASYALMEAVVFRLPGSIEAAAKLRGAGAATIAADVADVGTRASLLGLQSVATAGFERTLAGAARVSAENKDVGARLAAPIAAAEDGFQGALRFASDQLLANRFEVDAATFFDRMTRGIDAAGALQKPFLSELRGMLLTRAAAYETKRAVVLGIVALTLGLVGYAFLSFTRSLSATLRGLKRATDDLAGGTLREKIDLRSTDELQEIADHVAIVATALSRFERAQTDMTDRHRAGETGARIVADEFSGVYARMATGLNELADLHLGIQDRMAVVMTAYAGGDLSQDMDRLPGELAHITSAMDGVKVNLSAINAEISKLAGAAAGGDFSVRGDESRFEHAFRDMVVSMNGLMHTADTGLAEVSRVLGALSSGNLGERIDSDYAGTFGQLKDDANHSVSQLAQIVGRIRQASDSIGTASQQIAAGNLDLSQRTEEQASSLQQTASAMEELTNTVKQNADSARQASELAADASRVAEQGGVAVGDVVATMDRISESSRKIADIISVIDGIAFQTNILALNAAVEAARAGEQGRGFAVVASEVRSLAQRSANAAKEIKGLIGASVQEVDAGARLVDDAGRTMQEIVGQVRKVTDIMSRISAASQEQSTGIEEVNRAIAQMDQVTQQNAALVEESAAAAESMKEQASGLTSTVAVFSLGAEPVQPPAPPAARIAAADHVRAFGAARGRSRDKAGDWATF